MSSALCLFDERLELAPCIQPSVTLANPFCLNSQGQLTEEEQQRYLVDFERKMMERMDSVAREAEEEDRRRAEAKGVAAATGDDDEEDDYHRRHRYTAEDAPRGQQGPIFADRYDANEVRHKRQSACCRK